MLDEMKVGDLIKLVGCLSGQVSRTTGDVEDHGMAIVVLDRGFVYVGRTATDSRWCHIADARNLRYWGTTKGLGQLVVEGPTDKTKMDFIGNTKAPMKSVISIHPTREDLWKRS